MDTGKLTLLPPLVDNYSKETAVSNLVADNSRCGRIQPVVVMMMRSDSGDNLDTWFEK